MIINLMSEQQKGQQQIAQQSGQNQEQLQTLLKETMKENKSLQGKNAKLQSKYVELFKQHKLLKKDHTLFVAFLSKFFNGNSSSETVKPSFVEVSIGQYEIAQLQKIANQKQMASKNRIQELQTLLRQREKDSKQRIESVINELRDQLTKDYEQKVKSLIKSHEEKVRDLTNSYEQKIKALSTSYEEKTKILTKGYQQKILTYKQSNTKQSNSYLKELQALKKLNKVQSQQLSQIRNTLQLKNSELSKISKQKLKLQHHLNNIRKKEIAQQLNPDKDQQRQKLLNERNEFLSLRQQVEGFMAKRDQLKKQLKQKEDIIADLRQQNTFLEQQISRMKKLQAQLDEKYELVRQCTMEELQNLILTQHTEQRQVKQIKKMEPDLEIKKEKGMEENSQIQKQYLKNILTRYIKAETSGSFEQALTLLEIIGTLLKLDNESAQALENYKSKRKQWWYIKY